MSGEVTRDVLAYLGKMSDWIKTCPDTKTEYGEFYAEKITVTFNGETIGQFRNEDPEWVFAFDPKYWGIEQ